MTSRFGLGRMRAWSCISASKAVCRPATMRETVSSSASIVMSGRFGSPASTLTLPRSTLSPALCALPWIEMYRKIQRRGRSLQICCLCEDLVELCDALKPEGLALWVDALGGRSPFEADDLFAEFCRKYS